MTSANFVQVSVTLWSSVLFYNPVNIRKGLCNVVAWATNDGRDQEALGNKLSQPSLGLGHKGELNIPTWEPWAQTNGENLSQLQSRT